jgi:hypothetical protein
VPIRDARAAADKTHLTVAIWAPPKTGKTMLALNIAKGLSEGRRFAVLDTERKGTLLYAHAFDFDVETELTDFSPDSYLSFIAQVDGRYPVIVIDSLSHAWFASGGILDIANRAGASRSGSPFGGWGVASPAHNRFMDALLTTKSHLVCTMRAKTRWEIVTNSRGKLEPKEVGMEAVQRDGVTYEFDALFYVDDPQRHVVTSMGSRLLCRDGTNLLDGYVREKPGPELGQMMLSWLRTHGDRRAVLEGLLRERLGENAELLIQSAQTADDLQAVLSSLGG